MEEENKKEEDKWRKQVEERAKREADLKEKRYKRLMHLLNQSVFYSNFLLQQIDSQELKNRRKEEAKARIAQKAKQRKGLNKENSQGSASASGRGTKRKQASG